MLRPQDECRDPDGEADVKALAEALRAAGREFVDPHFPPNEFALYLNAKPGTEAAQTFRKDKDPFLAGVTGYLS